MKIVAKILAVDDSASMRQMISFTLSQAGHSVVEGVDGLEGLEKAKLNKTDIVISDVNMPNMNGVEMVTEIRNLPDYKFTPILMLTTESSKESKMAGKAAGGNRLAGEALQPRATACNHQ